MNRKIVIVIVLIAVAAVAWLWLGRDRTESGTATVDAARAADSSEPVAAVAKAERHRLSSSLTLAGEFKAFQDVDVHAKVAGYIRKIYVDVGDHVKEGQTLAVLEVPELAAQLTGADAATRAAQQQIMRAQGDLQRAQSNHAAAHSAYTRLAQAAASRAGLVAQQEVDDSHAKDLESEGQMASAEAELSSAKQQLEVSQASQKQVAAMSNYTRIVAPFTGVVTNRFADTGALVAAGTSSSAQAIAVVRLAEISVLRLVLPIPESAAGKIRLGEAVNVRVPALNRDFEGKVARFADSLDMQTRTMETEIDVQNRDGSLIPGMYTETSISLGEKPDALTVPLQAVSRNGDSATVLALSPENVVQDRQVRLGMEDETNVEVLSGLSQGERVIIGNRSGFRNGQKVQPKEISAADAKPGSER